MGQNCGDFKTFQSVMILILIIMLRKLQNSKKKSKNKNVSEYGPRSHMTSMAFHSWLTVLFWLIYETNFSHLKFFFKNPVIINTIRGRWSIFSDCKCSEYKCQL